MSSVQSKAGSVWSYTYAVTPYVPEQPSDYSVLDVLRHQWGLKGKK